MSETREWSLPPSCPELEPGEVAVWRLQANAPRPLETVLGAYLGAPPGSLTLRRSGMGKPELEGSTLRVSLTHGGQVALVAVARGREVGIDIEPLRNEPETWSLPSHALTAEESARLAEVPAPHRSWTFLWMWARKEALLKAAGVGLAVDPRRIELAEDATVVAVPPELGGAGVWTLVDVPLPDHAAALAVEGALSRVLLYRCRSEGSSAGRCAGSASVVGRAASWASTPTRRRRSISK